ncbi:MAG: hypothetical protein Q9187_002624 [Circinaria calcarea]
MEYLRKLADIREGFYLSDVHSQRSVRSGAVHDATERPVPIAVYDPQASFVPPKLKFSRSGREDTKDTKQPGSIKSHSDWLQAKEVDPAFDRLEIRSRVSEKRNIRPRLSVTPSFIYVAPAQPLSVAQTVELSRLSRHGPPVEVDLPVEVEEPPDGGTLAWLHTFAGHLVAFAVQGLNLVRQAPGIPR